MSAPSSPGTVSPLAKLVTRTSSQAHSRLALLVVIVLIALLFRAPWINYDLPYVHHPDEPQYVETALRILRTGDLNPHAFYYPSLFFYVNAASYVPYYWAGKLRGVLESTADISGAAMTTSASGKAAFPTLFLIGRSLSVLFSTATVVLVYWIGRQLTRRTAVGLVAALMLAVSPIASRQGQLITPTSLATFLATLAVLASLQLARRGSIVDHFAAASTVGLAASAKYNVGIVAISLIVSQCLIVDNKRPLYTSLAISAAVTMIAYLFTSPFSILDHATFLQGLTHTARLYSTGAIGEEGDTILFYVNLLVGKEGGLLLLGTTIQVAASLRRRLSEDLIVAAFPVLYLALISTFVVRNERTLLPAIPFLCILAAKFLVPCVERVVRVWTTRPRAAGLFGLMAVAGLVVWPASQAARATWVQAAEVDTHKTARLWIAERVPPGSRIAVESYAPYIEGHGFFVQGFAHLNEHPVEWYVELGFDYLVFSGRAMGVFYGDRQRYGGEVASYESLMAGTELVKSFGGTDYDVLVRRVRKAAIPPEKCCKGLDRQ